MTSERNDTMSRTFRGALIIGCFLVATFYVHLNGDGYASAAEENVAVEKEVKTTKDDLPRKVVVGAMVRRMWEKYPGLDARLEMLGGLIDKMAGQAEEKYPGEGLDLVILNEAGVTDCQERWAKDQAIPLEGKVHDYFAAKARRHSTYIVVGMILKENAEEETYSNAAVLLDREGKLAGIYRKVHAVAYVGRDDLEGGVTPGKEFPVFDCDFGKLGIQICWDNSYTDGWDSLGKKGAELIAWPTASAQTVRPVTHAIRNRYYIVSSTGGNNATVFEPTGHIAAQVEEEAQVLVHQIDLSYMFLHWSSNLRGGKAFTEKFGDRAGYHWAGREGTGLFWSNDPEMPIGAMARELDLADYYEELERNRVIQDAARGGPPEE